MSKDKVAIDRLARSQSMGRQRGFTFLELSLVLTIGAGFMTMMSLSMQVHLQQLAAQSMAERYRGLQAATARYAKEFSEHLAAASANCSTPMYRTEVVAPHPVISSGACSATLSFAGKRVVVFNIMQPSVNELRTLGLLESHQSVALLLAYVSQVLAPAPDLQGMAPAQLGVLLKNPCSHSTCARPSAYEVLVYNLQPYRLDGGPWLFTRRDQATLLFTALGDGAAASDGSLNSELLGPRGSFRVINPVIDSRLVGLAGIIGLRSVTLLGDESNWARKDGQSVISGDWNFGQHRIEGLSHLQTNSLQANRLRLNGRAELDTATVDEAHVKSLQVDSLRLPGVNLGDQCVPTNSSLGIDVSSGGLQFCNPKTRTWSSVAP
jgi:prepilin-type N-terminal cleavage/methylation domain-containing protein